MHDKKSALVWPGQAGQARSYRLYESLLPTSAASVVQLDARPTEDQEVAGSTPAEVGNILSWRLIMKYFLRSFSPFR